MGVGYSGRGAGRNNPSLESIQNIGPIPQGRYRIGSQYTHPSKGPVTMTLTPVGHAAQGRTHFLIHGDSIKNSGDASEGCIVLNRSIRQTIAASGDTEIEVVQ
ncbi:MAG TPA: tlde1 domain-containing protein [Thiobacillus sp.]